MVYENSIRERINWSFDEPLLINWGSTTYLRVRPEAVFEFHLRHPNPLTPNELFQSPGASGTTSDTVVRTDGHHAATRRGLGIRWIGSRSISCKADGCIVRFASNPSFPGESTVTEPGIIHPNGQTAQDQPIHKVFRVLAALDREAMYFEPPKCPSIKGAKTQQAFCEPFFHFGIS